MTHGVLAPQGPTFTSRAMVSGSRRRSSAPWVRPADWLALTTPAPSEQKVVGLYAVHEYTFTTAVVRCTGDFTVDWGDGAGPVNYASNTNAEKVLSWSDYSSATLTSDGFRQAVITVAPQAGQTITFCDFSRRHSAVPQLDSSQWLDIRVSLPSGDFQLVGGSPQRYARVLQSFTAVTPVSGYYLFRECVSLQDINLVGLLGTNFTGMYQGCVSATAFPALDTSLGTNFTNMYYNCVSATAFPALDTSLGTNFASMYNNCYSATEFPALDTSLGTNFSNMYTSCVSATAFPALDTSLGTNFSGMYYNCYSATEFPALDTSLGTTFSNMYQGCYSATEFPALDTSLGTTFSSMYYNCYSATEFPALDTSLGTNFSGMYYNCYSATEFPALDTSLGTTFSNMYYNCTGLGRSLITGTRYSISYASTPLSATEIDAIFTRLGTAAGTQTITVTGTPGAATCTPSIATSKGWTVAA